MNFLKSFSFTFLTKAFSIVVLLLCRILLARLLGPSELGSFGNALNLTTLFARWSSLGTVPATQFVAAKHAGYRYEILTITMVLSVILGISGLLFFYLLPTHIVIWQFGHDTFGKEIFEQLIPFLPIVILSMTLPINLLGQGDYKAYSTSQIVPLIIQTSLLGFAFMSTNPVQIVIAGQITYWILMAVISLLKNRVRSFHLSVNSKIATDYVRMALKMFPLVILQYTLARFPILAGSRYLSTKELGYFILASNLSEAFLILYTAITPIIFNRTLKSRSCPIFLIKVICYSGALMLIILILVLTSGGFVFLYLFGERYLPSWRLLQLLSPTILLHGIFTLSVNHFVAIEKTPTVICTYLAGILTLAISCILFCPAYGVIGLCYSSILSALATALICIFLVRKESNTTLNTLLLSAKEDWHKLINKQFERDN
jgi:O-antigen/teichoic acid export membrane protein